MESLKELLDTRICDIVTIADNTQTIREFIQDSEKEFQIIPANLDHLSNIELENYLNFLEELWNK